MNKVYKKINKFLEKITKRVFKGDYNYLKKIKKLVKN